MTSRLADLTSIPHAQNFLAAKSHPAGRRESWRLVLLTTHSAGSESSTRSTGGGAGSKDEGGDGTDSEPVSVTELGLESTVPDPVPDDDPESKVEGQGDQGGEESEEGGEGHEDGTSPRGEGDSEESPDDGQEGESSGDRVQDHGLGKVLKDRRTFGVVSSNLLDTRRIPKHGL